MNQEIGKRVAYFRKVKNMTLKDLSERSGISKGYLSQLENGLVRNPSLDTLQRLAGALGVHLLEILGVEPQAATEEPLPPLDQALDAFISERRRSGRPIPEDIIQALAHIRPRRPEPMTKEDWAYLYETIVRVVGAP